MIPPPPATPRVSELQRIIDLPRVGDAGADVSELYRRPGGTQTLRPAQSRALAHAAEHGGILAPVGVGHGKTLICALLPVAVRAARPLLLIPASQRADFGAQWAVYSAHWHLAKGLTVHSYDALSRPDATAMLTDLAPDLIICDEAHRLSDQTSTRTRRLARYLAAHPETMFCALSGSFTARSVKDYAHLASWALGERSPLPRTYHELEVFSLALDTFRESLRLGGPDQRADARRRLEPLRRAFSAPDVRSAYRLRLTSCPGVVATTDASVDIPIRISTVSPPVPDAVAAQLAHLEATWTTPSGEEIEDVLAYARVHRQLSLGFFYRWVWPDNKPDSAWLEARADWHRELRAYLPSSREGADSPHLASVACAAGSRTVPATLARAWGAWEREKDKPTPPTECVWVDYFAALAAVRWAYAQPSPPLVWYEHTAFGLEVARIGGLQFAGVGPEADSMLASMRAPVPLVLSVDAHGTGKNLQLWSRQLVTSPSSSGRTWEQLVGRTHRPGQSAPVVHVDYYAHAPAMRDAVRCARDDARYIAQTLDTPQKLGLAVFS